MDFSTVLVRTVEGLDRVRSRFEIAPVLSFDVETTSLTDFTFWGVGLAYAPQTDEGKGFAAYIACEEDCELDFHEHIRPLLEELFADTSREIVGHNLKFDIMALRRNYVENIPHRLFDTMIASWMLSNEEKRQSIDAAALRFLRIKMQKDLMELRENKAANPKYYWEQMTRYGTEDVVVPLKLRQKMIPELMRRELKRPFKELEMPVVNFTAEMQMNGVRVNTEHLASIEAPLELERDAAAQQVYDAVGYEFNINSPKQLSKALFEDLGLAPKPWMSRGKPRKVGTLGDWPTGVKIMKAYANPATEGVLDFRGRAKLLGTYVGPMQTLALAHPEFRIFTDWKQAGTATGRYSSSSPFNLQNLPRAKGLIRKAIVPTPGFKIVACDYSQVELRLMAHMSGDPVMVQAYKEGLDLHRRTAAAVLGISEVEVTKDQRQFGKPANFGFLYGMSAKRFLDYARLNYGVTLTMEEAETFREAYFRLYRGVKHYHDYMRDYIYEHGYTLNFVGERRNLPEHRSTDPENGGYKRWQAWSEGTNFTIQGSAAALIKIAARNIYRELVRPHGHKISTRYGRVLTCWKQPRMDHEVRSIMQVHDELVFEARNEIADEFGAWLKMKMETAVPAGQFRVPIIAEVEIGPNLEDAKA